MQAPVFHVAVAVNNIHRARDFYLNTLGCRERADTCSDGFLVLNFFGAQLVLTESADPVRSPGVDPGVAPHRHFGLIMNWDDWHRLRDDLSSKNVAFHIQPNIKNHSGIGKVGTLFISDPAGNYLEFKSYQDPSRIY